MRPQLCSRSLVSLALAASISGCSGSSPAAPTGATSIQGGNQVLRTTFQGPCPSPDGNVLSLFPMVYTRVLVRQEGTEWIASATTATAGDVDLRFHSTGSVPGSSAMMLAGTIAGTARHMPEILPNLPAWESSIGFGSDRRTVVNGVALAVTGTSPNTGVDGTGSGTITLSNSSGGSCSGTAFSWTLSPL